MTISKSLAQSLLNAFVINNRSEISKESTGSSIIVRRIYGRNFIPSSCIPFVARHLYQNNPHSDIVVPLVCSGRTTKKTSDSIINTFFNKSIWSTGFSYVDTTKKGYGYYGNKGVILTDDYKPLLVCGYELEMTQDRYKYKHPVCFISPDVFVREDMVSKCIVKKVIPYYSKLVIANTCNYDYNGNGCDDYRVKIIVTSDIDKFIHKAIEPLDTDVNDEIYDILSSNIEALKT